MAEIRIFFLKKDLTLQPLFTAVVKYHYVLEKGIVTPVFTKSNIRLI